MGSLEGASFFGWSSLGKSLEGMDTLRGCLWGAEAPPREFTLSRRTRATDEVTVNVSQQGKSQVYRLEPNVVKAKLCASAVACIATQQMGTLGLSC